MDILQANSRSRAGRWTYFCFRRRKAERALAPPHFLTPTGRVSVGSRRYQMRARSFPFWLPQHRPRPLPRAGDTCPRRQTLVGPEGKRMQSSENAWNWAAGGPITAVRDE